MFVPENKGCEKNDQFELYLDDSNRTYLKDPHAVQEFEFCAKLNPQAAQALLMNHTRNTIWRRIIRVCMGFSTRYP